MKKILIAAVAVCAVFASCSKDENGQGAGKDAVQLSIKISGVTQPSRAVEDPGSDAAGTIDLDNGHIFVINPTGGVIYNVALDVTAATNAGQALTQPVPADSRVYILGNIPSDAPTMSTLTTFDAIKAATSAMTTQTDYTKAALANSDGQPASITPGANNTASATVSIKPLISRMELAQVKGSGNITAFTVSGVYVDSYYPSFTYGGSYAGNIVSQGQSTSFSGIGDTGSWAAAGNPLVASPASGSVWAHNVASGGLPRFIIALDGVKWDDNGTERDMTGTTYYLTVSGYSNVTAFERGKIYRIGGDGANGGIGFDEEDLGLTPNPVDIALTLNVSIVEWEIVTPAAEL